MLMKKKVLWLIFIIYQWSQKNRPVILNGLGWAEEGWWLWGGHVLPPIVLFLSLKVGYCKCWWKKVLWLIFLYLSIIPEKQTSYLEWPWLSRRGMMTMRRTCFAACCSFSCPFAQPSSQSLDSHSLSIEDALHSDYWIGFQWAHTLARTSAAARWR